MGTTINVKVSATLRSRTGVEVTIDEREIVFEQLGTRGGRGAAIAIAIDEWPAIETTVSRVRAAIAEAKAATEHIAFAGLEEHAES